MMLAPPMMFALRMMCGVAAFYGKHCIIATKGSNIMFAKQMHHIAKGDASCGLAVLEALLSSLEDCSSQQLKVLNDIVKAEKTSMRK